MTIMDDAETRRRSRFKMYQMGWRFGAFMKAIPPECKDDPDFVKGYTEGNRAYSDAMHRQQAILGIQSNTIIPLEGERAEDEDTKKFTS